MQLSNNIRSFRKEHCLTQEQFTEAPGVTAMECIANVPDACGSEALTALWRGIAAEGQRPREVL